ncbi:glycoside hydrolase family 31 protein [Cellulomonas dongxiuzhuiae]|uniref:Glycoside hydrolase family 31 protein n=1 Tax=Cellulomonas dongxiuzhuiae TaxID=2819979 RepID=A0ABX8GJY9_9CELL|nr:TIM-barrel domain-containing protein [Cellulomonas dongxiuzhuiae]MBO3095223.1 glycoside hydrolase [Cellulomonas dongxiuzhuiae]QWC16220.1 glycoside hydrolase family 31 protein [Cellulomonas dongxiuzhuiae]
MALPTLPTHPVADPAAVVQGDRYRITVLTDGLLRLEHSPDGVFEDRPSTFALHRRQPVPEFRVVDRGTHLEVVTRRLRLTYDKGPFTTSGLSVAVLGAVTTWHSVWRYGQDDDGRNLGGTARTLDEADGAVPLEPGVVGRNGYAVIDDSTSLLLTDDGWVAPRDDARTDLYVFAYGHDHAEAVRALYAVSGAQPVVPRWALGNWWSRYHRYTADEYLALLTRFRAAGVPFSVAVLDMDWHVTDVDAAIGSGWTGYTWDRELFPDPAAFLADVHARGLRVTLNVHPADGVGPHEEVYEAMCAALGLDPSTRDPIAFDVTDEAFLTAYLDVMHRGLEADGVDFWWIDWQQGAHSRVAGIDPLWMLNHFHFLDNARDGRRPLTFSRYAGPGSHRYPVGFSGDAVISWASLAFQPHFTAAAANIGYGWWSHDVGGHMFGAKDDELATRWVQLGTFSPVLRLHSSHNPFLTKEPWSFGPEHAAAQTDFLRLRHRLVPYLHTMNHRAAREGVPLVTPMYHRWSRHAEAYRVPGQLAFGSQLLVAPVTAPRDPASVTAAVRAWLPEGTWVDVLTGLVYDGGRELVLHRDLTSVPVLAPAGALVPLDAADVPGDDPVEPEALEVLVVVGADGAFTLVEDDGTGDGLDESRVARTPLVWDQAAGVLTVGPVTGAHGFLPATRTWTATFLSVADDVRPGTTVEGGAVEPVVARTADGRLRVTVADVPVDATLRVGLGAAPALRPNDVASRLHGILDAAQVGYELKSRVLDVLTSARPLHVRLSHLAALDVPPALRAAVEEVVLARATA